MQALRASGPSSATAARPSATPCCRPSHVSSSSSCSGLPQLPMRSPRHSSSRTQRSSQTLRAFGSSMEAVTVVSQLVTTGAIALGAWYLMERESSAYTEQDNINRRSEPCPRCEGVGYEPCVCTRWSDGDHSGCASCSKTGYMPCRACRGGGTAVPLLASVRKHVPGQMPGRR